MPQIPGLLRCTLLLSIAVAASAADPVGSVTSGSFVAVVSGITSNDGSIYLDLYAKADGFLDHTKAVQSLVLPAAVGGVTAVFAAVPFGTYAITAYHDANGNGKMDSNFLGIPKEPVGMTNNPHGSFGPPSFADAKVDLHAATLTVAFIVR